MSRLQYFDMLKGIAIFLVILDHIIWYCVGIWHSPLLFSFISSMHMPLFFFISGWFSYKSCEGMVAYPRLSMRALQLLTPLAILPLLWLCYYPHSGLYTFNLPADFVSLCYDNMKGGYWFTPVLFIIILIYFLTVPILRRCKSDVIWIVCILAPEAVFCILVKCLCIFSPETVGLLSLFQVIEYYPIFAAGIIASRSREFFINKIITDSRIYTLCILTFLAIFAYIELGKIMPEYDYIKEFPALIVMRLAFVVAAMSLVKAWSESAFVAGTDRMARGIASVWSYLGRKSLAIYLLQYFFIFPLGCLVSGDCVAEGFFVPDIFVYSFAAFAVIAIILLVNRIISSSPILALVLTGTVPDRLKRRLVPQY